MITQFKTKITHKINKMKNMGRLRTINQKNHYILNKKLELDGYKPVDLEIIEVLAVNRLYTCYTPREVEKILKYFEVLEATQPAATEKRAGK